MHEAVGKDDRTVREELRRSLREQRAGLAEPFVRAASADVCAIAAALPAFAAAVAADGRPRRVALYAATRGEIDPAALRATLHARGFEVAYPRVASTDPPHLDFVAVGEDAALVTGSFGILEPAGGAAVAPESIDLFIVPGIAFARDGHRLGFGRGYYDRVLAAAPRALRVGLCHQFQLVETLPPRAGDEPVDLILTPRERLMTGARPLAPEEVLS